MYITVTKTFYLNTSKKSTKKDIENAMLDSGYEKEELNDEDCVEEFIEGLNCMDLEDIADLVETDVDIE